MDSNAPPPVFTLDETIDTLRAAQREILSLRDCVWESHQDPVTGACDPDIEREVMALEALARRLGDLAAADEACRVTRDSLIAHAEGSTRGR